MEKDSIDQFSKKCAIFYTCNKDIFNFVSQKSTSEISYENINEKKNEI